MTLSVYQCAKTIAPHVIIIFNVLYLNCKSRMGSIKKSVWFRIIMLSVLVVQRTLSFLLQVQQNLLSLSPACCCFTASSNHCMFSELQPSQITQTLVSSELKAVMIRNEPHWLIGESTTLSHTVYPTGYADNSLTSWSMVAGLTNW